MSRFVFEKDIFQKKFVMANGLRNRAKSIVPDCDSVCPVNSDKGNAYKGLLGQELLADVVHYLRGEVVIDKKMSDLALEFESEVENQVFFKNKELCTVFKDIVSSFFFENSSRSGHADVSILRFRPASKAKEFGKFVVDVFLDSETRHKLLEISDNNDNPLDDIVSRSYMGAGVLRLLKTEREYARIFSDELRGLFELMNRDLRSVLDGKDDVAGNLEFLLTYYLFIYLSQVALRLDRDLKGETPDNNIVYFKVAKEPVSEDRDCVAQGWRKIERRTGRIFKHLTVLNMLNCHDNSCPYATYSDLYEIYKNEIDNRPAMEEALDYIIDQYTKAYTYDTDIPGEDVVFPVFSSDQKNDLPEERFKQKVQYLYDCVSRQLDSKGSRRSVVSNVAGNYDHILKMRFVKSWGQLGHMVMISNEDLIRMIQVCQRNSDRMDPERGIQINDLFAEFAERRLYMDGKTRQYVIDHLVRINLIDSKCDSEEAQYVKRIR